MAAPGGKTASARRSVVSTGCAYCGQHVDKTFSNTGSREKARKAQEAAEEALLAAAARSAEAADAQQRARAHTADAQELAALMARLMQVCLMITYAAEAPAALSALNKCRSF